MVFHFNPAIHLIWSVSFAMVCAAAPCEGAAQSALPAKRPVAVYFVPIDPVSAGRIAELQRYYGDSLDLETAVLPIFTPSPDAWNSRLLQWRAETLAEELIEREESLLRSGRVVVIGITGDGLQSVAGGGFFGWRTNARTAIVSSFGMKPPRVDFETEDEEVVRTRVRKMVTKYIGMLYYDMPTSTNPESPLYAAIDGLTALDRMGESLGDPESMSLRPLLDYREAVNLASGIYVRRDLDFVLEDTPRVVFRRAYQSRDTKPRGQPFGIGTGHSFATFLVGDAPTYSFIDLILEDGARVHYRRLSPGTGDVGSIFVYQGFGAFAGSRLSWEGRDWLIRLEDGASRLHYDYCQRISLAWDDSGKSVSYEYDALDRLIRATDADGVAREYEYDEQHRMVRTRSATLDETMAYDFRGLCVRYERRSVYYADAAGHTFERRVLFTIEYITGANGEVLGSVVTSSGPDGGQRLAFDQHGAPILPSVVQKRD